MIGFLLQCPSLIGFDEMAGYSNTQVSKGAIAFQNKPLPLIVTFI